MKEDVFYKVDEINAQQIEKAREAGREYQGKEPDAPKEDAKPAKAPEPTKAEQPAPESGSVARDTLEAESHKK